MLITFSILNLKIPFYKICRLYFQTLFLAYFFVHLRVLKQIQNLMQSLEIKEKTIDIEKLIRVKNKRLYAWTPKFIISWFKKLVHEKEMNTYLFESKDKIGVDFANAILQKLEYSVVSTGSQNIDPHRRLLIAANHPLGGMDGLALISEVGKIRRDILFPVNDLLLGLPNMRPLFIPINKYGNNCDNYDIFQNAFQSNNILLYFPAGLCSRKQKGKIADLEWKKTFITKAVESKRDIVPVFIDGQNSTFFYNLANWRKHLGLKINIEQFLLINEMFTQKNKVIHFIIGEAIPYQTFDDRFSDKEWAEKVKKHVYDLKTDPTKKFEVHT